MSHAAQRQVPGTPGTILVRNPYSGARVGEVAMASADHIGSAVARALAAQREFRRSTPFQRRTLLDALAARRQVIVLDLRLPDMQDLSLLGTLRQLVPGARLILMTAFGSTDIIAQAYALGAEVLSKPFELGELHRLVTQVGRDPR